MTHVEGSPETAGKRVLIFRNELLPLSETFIRAQAEALEGHTAVYAGVHGAQRSLPLRSAPLLVDASSSYRGKLQRRIFWRTAWAPEFYQRLRTVAPALIHAHFALDGAAALPLRQALRCPLVVTLHGYDVTTADAALARTEEGKLYLRRRRQLFEQAACFLCISEFIRERALERGFPEHKLRVLYTGVDLDVFTPQGVERDPDLIVFTGRLVHKKGCALLLEALALVRNGHPAVRLAILGSGPLEQALRERAAALALPCEFLGAQPSQVVRQYLARARVFCVPSVTAANGDSEGLGMVFAEAQAMGTPVVSFRHGGISEVVRHGHTGLLAREGDTAELAGNLLTLLTHEAAWTRMSACGRGWVAQQFDLRRQTRQLESIYAAIA